MDVGRDGPLNPLFWGPCVRAFPAFCLYPHAPFFASFSVTSASLRLCVKPRPRSACAVGGGVELGEDGGEGLGGGGDVALAARGFGAGGAVGVAIEGLPAAVEFGAVGADRAWVAGRGVVAGGAGFDDEFGAQGEDKGRNWRISSGVTSGEK